MTGDHHRSSGARAGRAAAVVLAALAAWAVPLAASAEESPRLGSSVEVRIEKIVPDHRFEDARGVHVAFRYRVGRVETDKALFLVAYVSAEGQKVRALTKSSQYRDRDGFLHGKKQLVSVPRNTWREDSLFLPYYVMKLAPGPHRLTLHLDARSDTGSCKTGELPRQYRVIGDEERTVDIVKPPYKMVQLLVKHIEVVHQATDSAFILQYKARPDLQWQVRFRAGAGGVMYNSETRDNAWSGTWSRYTDPFPFSDGDRMSLTVFDEDFLGDDVLGRFYLTLDEVSELGSKGVSRSNDKVTSLVFAPAKVR